VKNIAIVGFMGTGKTTIARLLAERLDGDYVDIDELIEEKEKMKITEIFEAKGEPYFRRVEKNIVGEVSRESGKIIACGGGVVLDEENIRNLKNNGVIVCLQARPEIILKRTKDYKHRPLLNVKDPRAKINELLEKRGPFYARADFLLDTSDLKEEEVLGKIINWVKGKV